MNERKDAGQGAQSSGLGLADIYYILFRHKWKIIVLSTLGLAAASYLYLTKKPVYGSEAELLVRYVLDAKLKVAGTDIKQLDPRGDNTINSEVRIFTSFDLATNVVKAIGAEKILGGPDPENDAINKAAKVIRQNIIVEPIRRTDVLRVVFQHPDKELVQPVLAQLITSYLDMHARIHNGLGVSDAFLSSRTTTLSNQLSHTESALREAKVAAGVVSTVDDAKKERADLINQQLRELGTAQSDLAGHEAALKVFSKPVTPVTPGTESTNPVAVVELPADKIAEYKELNAQLEQYQATKRQLLSWAREESIPVRDIQQQINDTELKKKKLEAVYPRLAGMPVVSATQQSAGNVSAGPTFDPMTEEVEVRKLMSRIELMNSKLTQYRREITKIEAAEPLITELQRKRDIEDTDYRFYENSLHQARMSQMLESGKLSNISVTQEPTPPYKDSDRIKKMCGLVAGGGIGAGIVLAFLLEMFLNQTVRRPNEIETRLRLPLMLSIPDTNQHGFAVPGRKNGNGHAKMLKEQNGEGAEMTVALWDNSHDLHLYFEALRDRLFTFFDSKNLKHNPKLVAVTACSEGAGVSTIAAGLAATLSETGDGNVLLVDMNDGEGAARPFYKGKPAAPLADALEAEKREGALVQNNLYVVAEGMNGLLPNAALPRQFSHLMPKLKASDYDYIIFDMPPVSQISVTSKMARLMDINLLVVESEKTDREIVKQASTMISGTKANLGIVLNKKRSYVPKWLQQEL